MNPYLLAAFLLLYGLTGLVSTQIPPWITHGIALAAGLAVLVEKLREK